MTQSKKLTKVRRPNHLLMRIRVPKQVLQKVTTEHQLYQIKQVLNQPFRRRQKDKMQLIQSHFIMN